MKLLKMDKMRKRFDTADPEVYLTPQHFVDKINRDVRNDGKEKVIKPGNETMRKNILGQSVPKRPKEHVYVQDVEDEYGYTLAAASVIDVPQMTVASHPTSLVNKHQSNAATLFQRIKNHRGCVAGFLVGLILSGILACVIYYTMGTEPGNFM